MSNSPSLELVLISITMPLISLVWPLFIFLGRNSYNFFVAILEINWPLENMNFNKSDFFLHFFIETIQFIFAIYQEECN